MVNSAGKRFNSAKKHFFVDYLRERRTSERPSDLSVASWMPALQYGAVHE
jgi:hypothetical protein